MLPSGDKRRKVGIRTPSEHKKDATVMVASMGLTDVDKVLLDTLQLFADSSFGYTLLCSDRSEETLSRSGTGF